MSQDERRSIVVAFDCALEREAHNLVERPELTWQQLHNRLQWGEECVRRVLGERREHRHAIGGAPWIRTRTPFGESEAVVRVLEGHTGAVNDCAFSADGRRIVSAGSDQTLKIWDSESGAEVRTLETHARRVEECAFSTDGRRVISHGDGMLWIWDAESGEELLRIRPVSWIVDPDPYSIAASSGDRRLLLANTSNHEKRRHRYHRGDVRKCAVSRDGRWIVSTQGRTEGRGATIRLLDAETGEELSVLEGHEDSIYGCAVSPDGRRIVSGSGAGPGAGAGRALGAGWHDTLLLWDVDSGAQLHALKGHEGNVNDCVFSPDGRSLVSAADDNLLKLWDVETGNELRTLRGHSEAVTACAFSLDGRRIVSASMDRTLRIWNAESGEELSEAQIHSGGVRACAVSPDGRRIASAGRWFGAFECASMQLWDVETGRRVRQLRANREDSFYDCAFGPDGSWLVYSAGDRRLSVDNADTGERIAMPEVDTGRLFACAVSPDGSWIASGGWGKLVVWDMDGETEIRTVVTLGENEALDACAFSPDGRRIASAGKGTLRVFDAESGDELHAIDGHADDVSACAFSPDGRRIVSASLDRTLKVWDADTGEELRTLTGHDGRVQGGTFSPDGRRITSAADDGTLRVWDTATGEELATLPLLAVAGSLAPNPGLLFDVCGDSSGALYVTELMGVDFGPAIVTPVDLGAGPVVRCAACLETAPVDLDWAGQEVSCPRGACGGRMVVNRFVVGPASEPPAVDRARFSALRKLRERYK